MNAEWFYSEGSDRKGPVTEDELRRLVADGSLTATDLVWRDGMPDWVEARTVQLLFPRVQADSRADEDDERPTRRRFDAEDRPSRRGRPRDDDYDDDRPSRRGRSRARRDELEDEDDDRPRVRRQTDDYEDEYESRPRRRRNQKPSQVQAVGIMMLIGGILGIMVALGMAAGSAGFCCLWPVTYLELVWGILAIIRGVNMMNQDDQGPPTTLLVLQIICILNGDVVNCVLGIVGLVMLGDEQVKKYYRRRGFY